MANDNFELPKSCLTKIDHISRILNVSDKSNALEQCINFAEKLMTQMDRGGQVYYKTRKGKSYEILLPGDS